ncbi:MBL fold metallo-hydrolase [Nonomuraea angiospora]|uniref:Glyoxylase-like metal-dependent hydrolase (Beta-lactamase superfamily II) n=1 Tax=Nonomuraea angiospora TaxID=46172 RepID=A0ABR9LS26_9ACTN|nr:MBL fold metallo-hydrolase [Nonomuraea angiospora]MBE1583454.1 glyoxylase-like metal-dependent hydrolase (beta-lactamase superfamily II) [Nonomuraea angiospora]
MKIVEIRPELHLILLGFGQAYLWNDAGALTLVDTGIAGSGADIAAAIGRLGHRRSDVKRVVLTHFHEDHCGAAAEISGWGDVTVLAHRLEAPVIRGDKPAPPPRFTDEERVLHRDLGAHLLPAAPACRVDRELEDGDAIDFGGGARVIHTPGHTDGSIALHLPRSGVLFTGDTVAHVNGQVMPGVFNLDRAELLRSFRRLAEVGAQLACVGHGEPLPDAHAALTAAATALPG